MKTDVLILLLISVLISPACARYAQGSTDKRFSAGSGRIVPAPDPVPAASDPNLEKIFTDQKSLDYKGYRISKTSQKSRLENGRAIDVEFASLSKNNRKLLVVDKGLDDKIRQVRFGLFALSGDEQNKQLVIESTANRYWRYIVVDLSDKHRVIFDSADYPVIHELRLADINKDGRYELIQNLYTFEWFGTNASYRKGQVVTPIVFKYDEKTKKYVFANPEFAGYLLNGSEDNSSIESKIERVKKLKKEDITADRKIGYSFDLFNAVMDVSLTYLYLGREKQAWDYFEEYDLPDKEDVRAEVKKYLAKDSFYNSLYSPEK